MFIARQKRRENIAEYILYLWQLEDLLRALKFDPQAVRASLVEPQRLEPAQREQAQAWYAGIADLLRQEGKSDNGHMRHTLHLVAELQQLHEQLMAVPAGAEYRKLFARLAPHLPSLRAAVGRDDMSDMELSMRALYAVMLYRMKGTESGAVGDVLEYISPVIASLADIYRRIEAGTLDIYKDDKDGR